MSVKILNNFALAMLDTGANKTFISEDFASRIPHAQVEHNDMDHTVILADGGSQAGIGYLHLPMSIFNHGNRGHEHAKLIINSTKCLNESIIRYRFGHVIHV